MQLPHPKKGITTNMPNTPELDQLKSISITRVINDLGVSLLPSGKNLTCCCPFHAEKTPSLVVYPHTNTWYCFGKCDRGYSNIDFVMLKQGLDFSKALEYLEAKYGYSTSFSDFVVPEFGQGKTPKPVKPSRVEYWHNLLQDESAWFIKRGITYSSINRERLGWDGNRYTIPVWRGKPGESRCMGVRRRASRFSKPDEFKYLGIKGSNPAYMYNRYACSDTSVMMVTAGELDALRATQDGIPTSSLVNGMTGFKAFPENWPILWYPKVKDVVVLFDKKEASQAGKFAYRWEQKKGDLTAHVVHWTHGYDDYSEFRDKEDLSLVHAMLQAQLPDNIFTKLMRSRPLL